MRYLLVLTLASLFAVEKNADRITPDAGAAVKGESDFFFTGEFLYWTARQDGLAYARSGLPVETLSSTTLPTAFSDVTAIGETKQIGTQWDPGFTVGVGLNLQHDGWDIFLNYTRFAPEQADATSSGNFAPLWDIGDFRNGTPNFTMRALYSDVSATWNLNFNAVNLEFGRNFYISEFLKLRPAIGFKGAWNKQTFITNFRELVNPPTLAATQRATTLRMDAEQDYWGLGVRAGLSTAFQFTQRWALFGSFDLAGLWGQFDSQRKDTATWSAGSTTTDQTYLWSRNKYHTVTPILELELGLRYDIWFKKDNHHFGISAGWQEQIWMAMNQFVTLNPSGSNANLLFQGFTLTARFDF